MPQRFSKNKENQEEIKRRKNHVAFFICILLAALAWLLIKLSDDYSVTYPFKVMYTHVPNNEVLETPEDSTVNISFKSDGYNLLDLMITHRLKSIKVDLSKTKKIETGGGKYRIPTVDLKEPVAVQLGVNETDVSFSTANLSVEFKKLVRKKVRVVPQLHLQFKSQYGLYHTNVSPGEVTIYGTHDMVDTIYNLKTDVINMNNLDSDKKIEARIINPLPGKLKIVPEKVKIELEIQKYTEFSLKVPIDVSHVSPAIKTFPTETTVYYNMFLKDYKELSPDQFKVVPDVKNLKLRNVKILNLRLLKAPEGVHNARLDPVSVEFIILN